ncbi:MAG: hypothetical protein AAFP03_08710 [Cyanobacteria bacterium J06598_3]
MFTWPNAIDNPLNSLSAFAVQVQTLVTNAIEHPVWAIALVILAIGLLQLLADLIKRLIKAALTFIFKLPLTLSQWVWKRATTAPNAQAAQVEQLMTKLEALREEQDQVISALKAALSQTKDAPMKLSQPKATPVKSIADKTKSIADKQPVIEE